jgi:hypothetical protein
MATSEYMRRTSFVGGDGKGGGFVGKQVTTLKQFEQRIIDGIRAGVADVNLTINAITGFGDVFSDTDVSVDGEIVLFSGTDGHRIKNSGYVFQGYKGSMLPLPLAPSGSSTGKSIGSVSGSTTGLWFGALFEVNSPTQVNSFTCFIANSDRTFDLYFYQAADRGLAPPFSVVGNWSVTTVAALNRYSGGSIITLHPGYAIMLYSATGGNTTVRTWATTATHTQVSGEFGTASTDELLSGQMPSEIQLLGSINYGTGPPNPLTFSHIDTSVLPSSLTIQTRMETV